MSAEQQQIEGLTEAETIRRFLDRKPKPVAFNMTCRAWHTLTGEEIIIGQVYPLGYKTNGQAYLGYIVDINPGRIVYAEGTRRPTSRFQNKALEVKYCGMVTGLSAKFGVRAGVIETGATDLASQKNCRYVSQEFKTVEEARAHQAECKLNPGFEWAEIVVVAEATK